MKKIVKLGGWAIFIGASYLLYQEIEGIKEELRKLKANPNPNRPRREKTVDYTTTVVGSKTVGKNLRKIDLDRIQYGDPFGRPMTFSFETKDEATKVFEALDRIAKSNSGIVSVGHLYQLIGLPTSHVCFKWGWRHFNDTDIAALQNEFDPETQLGFPAPVQL